MSDETSGTNESGAESQDQGSGEPSVEDIMLFDPFGPSEDAGKPEDAGEDAATADEGDDAKAGEGEDGADDDQTSDADESGDAEAAATEEAETQATKESADLAALNQGIQALNQTLAQGQTAEKTPAKDDADQATPDPHYNLGIPPEVIASMRSENDQEFAQGLHAIVNGISNRIWNDVQKFLSEEYRGTIQQEVRGITETQRTQAQIYEQFYGRHPTLNNQTLQPLIMQAGQSVMAAKQAAGQQVEWNEAFMDEVAEAVYSAVPALRPQADSGGKGKTEETKAKPSGSGKKKTFVSSPGSRGGSANSKTNEFADIL